MPVLTDLRSDAVASVTTPLLALLVPEGEMPADWSALDEATGGALRRLYQSKDFRGNRDETAITYPSGGIERLLVVGLGKRDAITAGGLRRAAAAAAKRARALGVPAATLAHAPIDVDAAQAVAALVDGVHQGAWRFESLKRPPEEPKADLATVTILVPAITDVVRAAHARGEALGLAHTTARGLQVLPGNLCTPEIVAEAARESGRRHGHTVTVLDRGAIEAEGMHALLAVGQGSANDPRFIVLEYRGAEGAPIVLVGKGVTFDTGGISLKPAERMEDMKFDMSGAAAVLGTFEMLGKLRPKVHVVGLIPSCENMPSGTAYKPGDVVRSHFGKTIEVINTDAEGRLILADALSYARRFAPVCVLDAATLTGAVVIGLGHTAAGLLGNDEALLAEVRAAGERAGERAWPLPLWDDYRDHIKSDIADVKNSGGRPAGTITAAWFLREFVEGYAWAHLDIAGTAYTDRDQFTQVKGPTGMAARLFSEFVLGRAEV